MRFVIVTGMSGAGKSISLKMLEDIGFFCVDNLPPVLINKFAQICFSPDSGIDKVALGIDTRGGNLFTELLNEIKKLENEGYELEVLFLDANDQTLVKRFKETRRKHPLVSEGRIQNGIDKERKILEQAKKRANFIIDTSKLLTRELKSELAKIFLEGKKYENLIITVLSFGFKYGIPSDADLVFDVRFIPNPFYIPELKEKSGNEKEIKDYVLKWDVSNKFIDKLDDMINFLIPNYIQEGKNQLVIAIGCTGGKHRSVTLANELYNRLLKQDYSTNIYHRDIEKDSKLKN
ncbi:RNase adapter RapZ [Vallitalea guaymasensis]|uniref:RNase adapter RapZ n=1 Tax=Vallitalea guaymasensis TaxID=1185412 RepID=A0A8J8MC07_9FIRM|nr:RNase adapter RapZ [Vallitalea guaymasensis]QUH30126.1 RNase adapter RapZ [Vallitalea guaymasensis]